MYNYKTYFIYLEETLSNFDLHSAVQLIVRGVCVHVCVQNSLVRQGFRENGGEWWQMRMNSNGSNKWQDYQVLSKLGSGTLHQECCYSIFSCSVGNQHHGGVFVHRYF